MKPISKLRFDALAGYSRTPELPFIVRELEWFEEGNEKVLGLLAQDLVDYDYAGFVLGRDKKDRFRAVCVESFPTQKEAYAGLESRLAEHAQMPAEEFYQGDEFGTPIDLFLPVAETENQHVNFRALVSSRGYSPARMLLTEMAHYFEDLDGNFVKDFQSTGFDSRLWELYLFGLFTELGYGLCREDAVPDFYCRSPLGEFFVEATTVNYSSLHPTLDKSSRQTYFDDYVPLMFGGALFGKLNKEHKGMRYWELPHVQGRPLLFALQDFHAPMAMSWSSTAMVEYLYGIRQVEQREDDGSTRIVSTPIEKYMKWNGKEIAAGFFFQPDSENVSAVLGNAEGTLSKFNRIGFIAGFGDRNLRMIRSGNCYRESIIPQRFSAEVHSPDYCETWGEGLSVYHNPSAKYPLHPDAIPGAYHFFCRDGRIMSRRGSLFHPIGSITTIYPGTEDSAPEV